LHGRRPQVQQAATRAEELTFLIERIGAWLGTGIEPHAIGVAGGTGYLASDARDALKAAGIHAISL
jgi:hypothetical protein